MGLKERFEAFMQTGPGFEDIDAALEDVGYEGKKRADYILWNRDLIVEQKALVVDPAAEPQKFVDKLIRQRRLFIAGTVSTDLVFSKLPDGKQLKRRMTLQITDSIEGAIRQANKQIADTRKIFAIPNALGMLVMLNERAKVLRPDVINWRLQHAFQKRATDGTPKYPHIDGVTVISDAHVLKTELGPGMPCFCGVTPHCRSVDRLTDYAHSLIQAWAAYNRFPIFPGNPITTICEPRHATN